MTSESRRVINVGLIGLGFAGVSLHLPALLRNSGVQIMLACDADSNRCAGFRATHAALGARTTVKWQDVVSDAQVDAIFIATPTPTHKELAIAALEQGKHVFCEKPIALSLSDAMEMEQVASKHRGRLLMIGQVLRYWPEYIKARDMVIHGRIGDVRIARTSRITTAPAGWYADEAQSGGVVVDLALHDIDYLIWTLGEVESIFAQGENCLGKGTANCIDHAQIQLNFKSGAIAHVEASWAVPAGFPFTTSLELSGTRGLLQVDNGPGATSLEAYQSGSSTKTAPREFDGYYAEIDDFVRAVAEVKDRAPVAVSDVLHALRVALAAKESIATGKIAFLENAEGKTA